MLRALAVSVRSAFRLPTIRLYTFASSINFFHMRKLIAIRWRRGDRKMIAHRVIRWRRETRKRGWIKKIQPAVSVTSGSRSASACCLSSSGRTWDRAFHLPAKTGQVRKRPIDSSPTATSVSRIYWAGIFRRRVSASPMQKGQYLFFKIRPRFPISEISRSALDSSGKVEILLSR